MNTRWVLAAVLMIALPALACSFSVDLTGETPAPEIPTAMPTQPMPIATLPPPEGPSVSNVFFAAGVSDAGDPVNVASVFPAGIAIVHAFIGYAGMSDGAQCDSVWYLDNQEIWRDAFLWDAGKSGLTAMAHIESEGGLPSGNYDWELYVQGELVVRGSFTVQGTVATLLEDDFSDPGSGWEVGDYTGGSVGYRDGIYFVTAAGETHMWGLASRSFDDVVIEVDATQISAPANDNNAYGVMCRLQSDDDGYLLLVTGDGFYAIYKIVDENLEPLVDWTASDAVRQGNSTNHIRAVCDGPDLSLSANGQLLAAASDSRYYEGDIALSAWSFEEESTEIHFDNLVVAAP